jgi:hypothetical protein
MGAGEAWFAGGEHGYEEIRRRFERGLAKCTVSLWDWKRTIAENHRLVVTNALYRSSCLGLTEGVRYQLLVLIRKSPKKVPCLIIFGGLQFWR